MLQKCSTKNVNTKLGNLFLGLHFSNFFLSLVGFKLVPNLFFYSLFSFMNAVIILKTNRLFIWPSFSFFMIFYKFFHEWWPEAKQNEFKMDEQGYRQMKSFGHEPTT